LSDPGACGSRRPDAMKTDPLGWVELCLVIGGLVLGLSGLVWHRIAGLLRFFGVDVDTKIGMKLALLGLVMMGVGFGLSYVMGSPR